MVILRLFFVELSKIFTKVAKELFFPPGRFQIECKYNSIISRSSNVIPGHDLVQMVGIA